MTTGIHTKFVTLIGTPLDQSFAARMQNTAYEAAGIDMHYFYTEADGTHLDRIMDGIRYMPSFAGCAVTKPNKVQVMQYLDGADPLCEKMGACNTVVRTPEGKLIGYNTDGIGFCRSLRREAGLDPAGRRFFCLGAGGAARAICAALAYEGAAEIIVTSRTAQSRETLVRDVNERFSPVARAAEPGDLSAFARCDAILNVTGVGMGKSVGLSPVPKQAIPSGTLCFDACYNPARTQFLLDAEARGCPVLNGLGMSLWQGAAQIELWSGRAAPVDAMRRELLAIVGRTE